jgi:hypothetical protein
MTCHAYPASALIGDYLRSAAGCVPALAILAVEPIGLAGATVLGGLAALFAVFGVRTVLRHGTRFESTDGMLRARGLLEVSISLRELEQMKLSYYSSRRDGRDGWMQLELRSGSARLRLDSRIEGFTELVEVSARAAAARGLSLSTSTLANLQAVGLWPRSAGPDVPEAIGEPR